MAQETAKRKIKAVVSQSLRRWVIIDEKTGEILDDAQGYGYKEARGAYAAYAYKNRDKSKDEEKKRKQDIIRKWCKEHKKFLRTMDEVAFEIAKGSWGSDDKFDAKQVKELLNDCGHKDLPFAPGQLLNFWRKHR